MQPSRLKASLIAASLFFSSLSFASGPDEDDKYLPFTGLSMMAGPTAVIAAPGTLHLQTRNDGAGDGFAEAVNIATNQYWSTGARISLEYGFAVSESVFIGINANFITGENWIQAFHASFAYTDRTNPTTYGPYNFREKFDLQYYINGLLKFGFIFDDSFLLYAEGGAGAANIFAQDLTDGIPTRSTNGSSWAAGWSAGVGLEWQFCNKFSIGTEYLYSGFQRRYITSRTFNETALIFPLFTVSSAMTMQAVSAYLRYFFS